jgi:hypothetical protein
VLKIAAIHEDCLPREWTTQVSRCAIRLVGPRCVRAARWTIEALDEPGALEIATEAAIEADILVVSVCADAELPVNLHRWIDSWLPCRLQRCGVLVAVIGLSPQRCAFPARIREYLRDVASLAHLDFLPQERSLPLENPRFPGKAVAKGAQARAQVFSQVLHTSQGLRWCA